MIQKRIFLIILLCLVAVFWFYVRQSTQFGIDLTGTMAPNFTLKNELGEKIKLSDARGKVVLVHFWATWCPPCVGEMQLLNAFWNKYADKNVALMAISEDEDGWSAVQKFKEKIPFDFHVLLDTDRVSERYGIYGLPETYLLDAKGRVVRKLVGPQRWNGPSWEAEINRLLKDASS
jgi:peroxiredoxin